jgi:hypothetical protein
MKDGCASLVPPLVPMGWMCKPCGPAWGSSGCAWPWHHQCTRQCMQTGGMGEPRVTCMPLCAWPLPFAPFAPNSALHHHLASGQQLLGGLELALGRRRAVGLHPTVGPAGSLVLPIPIPSSDCPLLLTFLRGPPSIIPAWSTIHHHSCPTSTCIHFPRHSWQPVLQPASSWSLVLFFSLSRVRTLGPISIHQGSFLVIQLHLTHIQPHSMWPCNMRVLRALLLRVLRIMLSCRKG